MANGEGRLINWQAVAVWLAIALLTGGWGLLVKTDDNLSRSIETVQHEQGRTGNRLERLEALRPEDRALLEEVRREQARQSRMLAAIAERLGVRE